MAEAGLDDDELSTLFEQAAERLTLLASSLPSKKLLYLYARFKQAKEGPCNIPQPGYFNFQAKQKWEAWKSIGDMDSYQAMREYVEEIQQLDPEWIPQDESSTAKKTSGFGPAFSTLRGEGFEMISDKQKDIFDWVKEGNREQVSRLLTTGSAALQQLDDDGMSLLHWASDRGHSEVIAMLLTSGANINQQDRDGQTALHYASSCGHLETLRMLIARGADTTIIDNDGQTPADVASDATVLSVINR